MGVVELRRSTAGAGDQVEIPQLAAEVVPVVGVDEEEVVAGPDDPTEPSEESHHLAVIVGLDVARECGPRGELPAAGELAEIGGKVAAGQADVISVEAGREADPRCRSNRHVEIVGRASSRPELSSRDRHAPGHRAPRCSAGAQAPRDGIVSALQVIASMEVSGESLHNLKQQMKKLPQRMINVSCAGDVVEKKPVTRALKDTWEKLNGKGRVLLRPSGTEPVVRIMVEGEDPQLVEQLAQDLASVVEQAAG